MGCQSCDFSSTWITSALPINELFNTINNTSHTHIPDVFGVLNSLVNQKYTSADEIKSNPAYVNFYFQYPNQQIGTLALEITASATSDDEKVLAIQEWVVQNIEYTEDKDQWGYEELWQPPMVTLNTRKGDCEDGAFLIISLALNAGVDPDRLRFYGGEVKAGEGARTGGHGWVAYIRESDGQWVVVDYSYYPDLRPMDDRPIMASDMRYIEQYFILEVGEVITSDKNRVRDPDVTYTANGYIKPNVLMPGTWMSQYA